MEVFIAGGTGFIGRHLAKYLLRRGFRVKVLVRRPERALVISEGVIPSYGNPIIPGDWLHECAKADVIINLVGANIFARWTSKYKELIYESRILTTKHIVSVLTKGQILLNASAIGFYGTDRGEEEITEESAPGKDFLAKVCKSWEETAFSAKDKGVRVCTLRLGIVLGRDGGALSKMLLPFKLGLGGPIGHGKQWFPWIHIEDVCAAVTFLIKKDVSGPFNLVAPEIVRNKEFIQTLARVLRRPALLPVPPKALELIFGELVDILVGGVKARPKRLLEAGYIFSFPELFPALQNLFKKRLLRR
ncbi:NAD-dependent epimerase/dehydratase [Thermodesulfatator indicus DSM 15286]|uniref:NAD-dependent epimerase/dehydratase n=1 Tax=Thermodesulfatator indicus (strain DSM 15286 / JCM 11887 / CIR29812) TaxID=667014 RepID=F8ACX2_THEID|nr:TIGR01777 family oxidoreductase [Thermodesulfatator indicus]AEH44766.1 NAD-dependent epimerase/dehydratase [Thermodesulfatator indicus DSM 15286]